MVARRVSGGRLIGCLFPPPLSPARSAALGPRRPSRRSRTPPSCTAARSPLPHRRLGPRSPRVARCRPPRPHHVLHSLALNPALLSSPRHSSIVIRYTSTLCTAALHHHAVDPVPSSNSLVTQPPGPQPPALLARGASGRQVRGLPTAQYVCRREVRSGLVKDRNQEPPGAHSGWSAAAGHGLLHSDPDASARLRLFHSDPD